MNNAQTVVVQILNDEEIQIRSVEPKVLYLIRDFNFSKLHDTTPFAPLLENTKDMKAVSNSLIDELQRRLQSWPLKCFGYGMTLLKDHQQEARLTITESKALAKRSSSAAELDKSKKDGIPLPSKPKGFVTGFNYFSKTQRNEVVKNHEHLSNNQLNQLLGQRWKALPAKDKVPFEGLAAKDKQRYKEEMLAYQAAMKQSDASYEMPSSDKVSNRPVTAYNHFVHQEKQYVFGLDILDPQTKMGKHGGDRWNVISEAEKALYVGIRDSYSHE